MLDNILNVDIALQHCYHMFLAIVNKHYAPLKEKCVKIANQLVDNRRNTSKNG